MLSSVQPAGRTSRPGAAVYSSARLLLVGAIHAALVGAAPIAQSIGILKEKKGGEEPAAEEAELWIYLSVALVLVLLGGAFAGLTIAYVG